MKIDPEKVDGEVVVQPPMNRTERRNAMKKQLTRKQRLAWKHRKREDI